MSPIAWLFLSCLAMFMGSLLAALVPLMAPVSPKTTKYLSILGAGLLVGTALTVVLPEAIALWMEGQDPPPHAEEDAGNRALLEENEDPSRSMEADTTGEGHEHHHPPTWQIGLSLMAGFALMIAVDLYATHSHGGAHHHGHSHGSSEAKINTDEVGASPSEQSYDADDEEEESNKASTNEGSAPPEPVTKSTSSSSKTANDKMAAVWGLLLHAAMDGVALGVACASASLNTKTAGSEDYRISNIMLMAIMLHKAPAAFGLTTMVSQAAQKVQTGERSSVTASFCSFSNMFLKLQDRVLLRSILLFSVAAPVGSVGAYLLVLIFASDSSGHFSQQWLAHAFLFAAGTFLHVATTHALPEALSEDGPSHVAKSESKHPVTPDEASTQPRNATGYDESTENTGASASHLGIRTPRATGTGVFPTPSPSGEASEGLESTEEEGLLEEEDEYDGKDSKISSGSVKRRIKIAYESGSCCALFPEYMRQQIKSYRTRVCSMLPQSQRSTDLLVLYFGMALPLIFSQIAGHSHG